MSSGAFALNGERLLSFAGMASISLEEYAACLGAQLSSSGGGSGLSVQLVHRSDIFELLHDPILSQCLLALIQIQGLLFLQLTFGVSKEAAQFATRSCKCKLAPYIRDKPA